MKKIIGITALLSLGPLVASAQLPPILRTALTTNTAAAGTLGQVPTFKADGSLGASNVTATGGSGEANVNGEVSITNATRFGLVSGKIGVTNLVRSIKPAFGLQGTNEGGTNIAIAVDPSVVAMRNNLTGSGSGTNNGAFRITGDLSLGGANLLSDADPFVIGSGGTVLNISDLGGDVYPNSAIAKFGFTLPWNEIYAGDLLSVTGSIYSARSTITNALTLRNVTASTVPVFNSSKQLTNTPNGTGMFTNNGSGVVGWMPIPSSSGSSVLTNANQFGATADGTIAIKSGALTTNLQATAIGIGQAADSGIGLVIANGGLTASNTATPNSMAYTNGQLMIGLTNFPGHSNTAALVLRNPNAGPTNLAQQTSFDMVTDPFVNNGASSSNLFPVATRLAAITTAGSSAQTFAIMTTTNYMLTNGAWNPVGPWMTNFLVTSAGAVTLGTGAGTLTAGTINVGAITSSAGITAGAASQIGWNSGTAGGLRAVAQGVKIEDSSASSVGLLWAGNVNAATNVIATNNVQVVKGALIVGPSGGSITNILTASATLDFPSTAAGGVSDLPITVTGCADGDVVHLGVPSGSITAISGDYFAWSSNGAVYVRFANNNLVTAQDPASGTFKVIVTKF